MKRAADWMIDRFTRAVNRVDPRVPVLSEWPGVRGVGRRVMSHFVWPAWRRSLIRVTALHRRRLGDVTFVGVTGSMGKTTTKDLIAAVAWSRLRGTKSVNHSNSIHPVARGIRKIKPGDDFAVVEIGASGPGSLDATLALVRPRVGVVTAIATDHYSAFGSLDAIAAEKRKLITTLPPDGTAVLNADDPRVLAMQGGFPGRVLTFGVSSEAAVRAEAITAAWPDRLAFTIVYEGRRVRAQTQLCGAHWVHSALAAVSVGLVLGIPLEAAAVALGEVAPFTGRMCPIPLPDGVTFIRDDWKASWSTIPAAVDFIRDARARRKIIIIGTISDTMGDAGAVYVNTARRALDAADHVMFVGPRSFSALRAKSDTRDDRLRAFGTVKAAAEHCRAFLEAGDLVLLKGSNAADHLYRIVLTRTGTVACWLPDCKRPWFCDECSLLTVPAGAGAGLAPPVGVVDDVLGPGGDARSHVLIGLGNPEEAFRDTPHNVGHLVVNRIAESAGASWTDTGPAFLARGAWQGESVCMVRLKSAMNHSGPSLRELSRVLAFRPEQCILIHDDLDLPLGAVRARMRGSDGGHRGVRSILEAFQTDQFRRVKVGVRRAAEARDAATAVLAAFTSEEHAVVEGACVQAMERTAQLMVEMRRAMRAQSR